MHHNTEFTRAPHVSRCCLEYENFLLDRLLPSGPRYLNYDSAEQQVTIISIYCNSLQCSSTCLDSRGGAGSLWAILNKECDTRNISHFPHLHAGHKMQDNKRGTRTKRGSNIKISSGRYMSRQPTSSHVTLWTWWLILRLTLWHHFPATEKMMEWAGRARCVECGECGECEEYQPVSVSPSQFAVVRPTHSHTHQHSKLHRNCKL